MELLELALLAVALAFWPILIVGDLVAPRTARPVPLLAWFLAGGLLTTISEGLVIVFVLEGTTAGSSRPSVGGWGKTSSADASPSWRPMCSEQGRPVHATNDRRRKQL